LELRHGLACRVWSLIAYKAVWVLALFLRKESHAFDITELAEEVTDVLVLTGLWDVFDEKVALFLGVLVLDSIAQNFLFAGFGGQEGFDIDFLSANFLSVEVFASLEGSGRSCSAVFFVFREISNHAVWAHIVFCEFKHTNRTVLRKKFARFILIEIIGQIFGVDVVENAPKIALVARLVFHSLDNIVVAELVETLGGAGDVLEANVTIATR